MNIWNPEDDQVGAELPPDDMFTGLDPRVADYMRKKQEAQAGSDRANMVANIGGVADSIANAAFGKPTVYQNNWQSMGQAPKMQAAPEVKNDFSGLQEQAKHKLDTATSDASMAVQQAMAQKKAELMQQIEARKAAMEQAKMTEDTRRFGLNYGQKDRELQEQAKLREAQQAQTVAQNNIHNDFEKQKIDLEKTKAGQAKKLSGDEQKVVSYAAATANGIRDIRAALKNGNPTFSAFGDNDFTEAARRAAENYGRLQSGGAINKDEEARFLKMLPGFLDPPDMKERKLKKMEAEMNARMAGLGVNPADQAKLRDMPTDPTAPVKMLSPEGKPKLIPADQVEAAIAAGGKRID